LKYKILGYKVNGQKVKSGFFEKKWILGQNSHLNLQNSGFSTRMKSVILLGESLLL